MSIMRSLLIAVLLTVSVHATAEPNMSIGEIADATPDLSILVTALSSAGLVEAVSGDSGNLTVFAPNNSAFEALEVGVLSSLLLPLNQQLLTSVLTYHVAPVAALSSSLMDQQQIPTLQGSNVTVTSLSPVMINSATVLTPDVMATNGVVHIIDGVLLPSTFAFPTIAGYVSTLDSMSNLAAALGLAGLVSTFDGEGEFTVFAPVNEAFTALGPVFNALRLEVNRANLTQVLSFHVVASSVTTADVPAGGTASIADGALEVTLTPSPMVNGAAISTANIVASNGYIHIIDSVLLPQGFAENFPDKNIVETVVGTPNLSTLRDAVVAAGLAGALAGENLTVFAPTNDAFSSLGAETLELLLLPVNVDVLAAILQYHVAGSKILSTELGTEVMTLNGTLMVSSINVSDVDFACAGDSIVHIINNVLIPSWFSADLLVNVTPASTATTTTVDSQATNAAVSFGAPMGLAIALWFAVWSIQRIF